MKTEEIKLPYIKEDFEIGIRVYRYISATDSSVFGKVVAVNNDNLEVVLDNRPKQILKAQFKDFQAYAGSDVLWGKCLPLGELYVGCPVSLTAFGYKSNAIITYVSDDSITLYYDKPKQIWHTLRHSKDLSLEAQLIFWKLEG